MPVDKFGRMSDTKTKDTGVSLTYINNNYVCSDGTTPVTGSIDMGGNALNNLPKPVNLQDVATKEYVDNTKGIDMIERNFKHLYAVHASYSGPLRKNEFQFSFGGNEANNSTTGFLIPHSGRIKKIKMRTPINQESFENEIVRGRVDLPDFKNENNNNGIFDEIGIIRCHEAYKVEYASDDDGSVSSFLFDFCFDDYLPLYLDKDAEVEEGDIINIRSMINLSFPPYSAIDDEFASFVSGNTHIGNTYLATFLIELDPL